MRCAISYDKERDLSQQKVRAWGEMQSLNEEPCYREEDIKNEYEKTFFRGLKCGIDEALHDIDMLVEDGELEEDAGKYLKRLLEGDVVMHLFSILDNQEEVE